MMNNFRIIFTSVILLSLLVGCSTVIVKHYAIGQQPPFCNVDKIKEKIVVYWGTAWGILAVKFYGAHITY